MENECLTETIGTKQSIDTLRAFQFSKTDLQYYIPAF